MSKNRPQPFPPRSNRPAPSPAAAKKEKLAKRPDASKGTIRETVESIVIAFILAFLFRTFEAEAFVIPTGSMAPTLKGRHKDVICEKCGFPMQVSASDEVDQNGVYLGRDFDIVKATCPICYHTMAVDPNPAGLGVTNKEDRSYSGDRILVAKFPYDFGDPKRWDVVVFKYPEDAKVNFIKRLIGLPGETIRIYHGDIYTRTADGAFQIERKPPDKVRAMVQIVYDNDRVVDEMTQAGWPARWQPWPGADGAASPWKTTDGSRSYEVDSPGPKESWLRYQHFVPSEEDWAQIEAGQLNPDRPPRPQLITDVYGYNTRILRRAARGERPTVGLHWVGDLMLDLQLDVLSDEGTALFDLVKAGRHYRAALDVATGQVELSISDRPDYHQTAQTPIRGKGTYYLSFANIDSRLLLWTGTTHWYSKAIDWTLARFDGATGDSATDYEPAANEHPQSTPADAADLAPVGIGAQGAALRASHVKLWRDVYYIADRTDRWQGGPSISDYGSTGYLSSQSSENLKKFFSNPADWEHAAAGGSSPFEERRDMTFDLEKVGTNDGHPDDQFFVLGDNSPASKDCRLWGVAEQHVSRKLLIGKALYVYWPHAWPTKYGVTVPLGDFEFDFPFWPNFERMKLVR